MGVSTADAMVCGVCGVWCGSEGRGRRPKVRWMQAGMGVLEGTIAWSMAGFEACGDTIAGKGGVEAGIKRSKGGCCRSSCDRAAAQRIYGVLGGSGHTSRSPKCTDTSLNK